MNGRQHYKLFKMKTMSENKDNWSIPVDGVVHVPDYLDELVNKIGMLYKMHTVSKAFGEELFICRIIYVAEQFFDKRKTEEVEAMAVISIGDSQKRYERLLDKTRQMREYQKRWYSYHIRTDLDKAKRLEREIDQLIAEEIKIQKSNQGEIF